MAIAVAASAFAARFEGSDRGREGFLAVSGHGPSDPEAGALAMVDSNATMLDRGGMSRANLDHADPGLADDRALFYGPDDDEVAVSTAMLGGEAVLAGSNGALRPYNNGDTAVCSGKRGGGGEDIRDNDVDEDEDEDGGDDVEDNGEGADDDDDGYDSDATLEVPEGQVRLVPSAYQDRSSTIFFDYPKDLGERRSGRHYVEDLNSKKINFRCHWERNCVKNAFARAGFTRTNGPSWNAAWVKHLSPAGFQRLNRYQRVNHFPGSWCIGRKDRLLRTISRAKRINSRAFNFLPEGFNLPSEYASFMRTFKHELSTPRGNPIWILKPAASSCGRGIRLIHKNNIQSVSKEKKLLLQRYIAHPYLVNKKKFDLRLYVLVTGIDPLRIYVFEEGLARFSTYEYTLKNLKSRFTHLTNYTINKKSKNFEANTDHRDDMSGSKWSLSAMKRYLAEKHGQDTVDRVMESVYGVIVKTLIAAEGDISAAVQRLTTTPGVCYELFGFDILLDRRLNPWLLEVNVSPSLAGGSPLDKYIKGILMADVFHLVGFVPYNSRAIKREQKEAQEAKMACSTTKRTWRSASIQDAWRRNPVPSSVDFSALTPEDWDVVMDCDDEFRRAGHFIRVFPRAETVEQFLPLFAAPRFYDGVISRWVIDGGLPTFRRFVPAANRPQEMLPYSTNAFMGMPSRPGPGAASSVTTQPSTHEQGEDTAEGAAAAAAIARPPAAPPREPVRDAGSSTRGSRGTVSEPSSPSPSARGRGSSASHMRRPPSAGRLRRAKSSVRPQLSDRATRSERKSGRRRDSTPAEAQACPPAVPRSVASAATDNEELEHVATEAASSPVLARPRSRGALSPAFSAGEYLAARETVAWANGSGNNTRGGLANGLSKRDRTPSLESGSGASGTTSVLSATSDLTATDQSHATALVHGQCPQLLQQQQLLQQHHQQKQQQQHQQQQQLQQYYHQHQYYHQQQQRRQSDELDLIQAELQRQLYWQQQQQRPQQRADEDQEEADATVGAAAAIAVAQGQLQHQQPYQQHHGSQRQLQQQSFSRQRSRDHGAVRHRPSSKSASLGNTSHTPSRPTSAHRHRSINTFRAQATTAPAEPPLEMLTGHTLSAAVAPIGIQAAAAHVLASEHRPRSHSSSTITVNNYDESTARDKSHLHRHHSHRQEQQHDPRSHHHHHHHHHRHHQHSRSHHPHHGHHGHHSRSGGGGFEGSGGPSGDSGGSSRVAVASINAQQSANLRNSMVV